jgi:hypothetical protein
MRHEWALAEEEDGLHSPLRQAGRNVMRRQTATGRHLEAKFRRRRLPYQHHVKPGWWLMACLDRSLSRRSRYGVGHVQVVGGVGR